VPTRSGLTGPKGASSAVSLDASDGAAFTLPVVPELFELPGPAFLRFRDAGTNAVLSFLKSRSSGAADTVAAAVTAVDGEGAAD